jgi:hypothetical protein
VALRLLLQCAGAGGRGGLTAEQALAAKVQAGLPQQAPAAPFSAPQLQQLQAAVASGDAPAIFQGLWMLDDADLQQEEGRQVGGSEGGGDRWGGVCVCGGSGGGGGGGQRGCV